MALSMPTVTPRSEINAYYAFNLTKAYMAGSGAAAALTEWKKTSKFTENWANDDILSKCFGENNEPAANKLFIAR